MQQLRDDNGPTLPHPHHHRPQPLTPIERLILQRVEDVEPRHPTHHRQRDHQQQPPRLAPGTGDRDVPTDRRDRERAAHNGFNAHAAHRKTTIAASTAAHAWLTVNRPAGSSRPCVRGFRASMRRSAMRLKPIATNRAAVNAMTTRTPERHVTGWMYDATMTPSNANGSAKIVCGSLTKFT